MSKKILFVTMHLPSVSVPEAGQKLAYSRLCSLSEKNNSKDIDLIAIYNEREESYINLADYQRLNSTNLLKITNVRRLINFLSNFYLPVNIAAKTDSRIKSLVKCKEYDYIHIEFEQGISNIPVELWSKCNLVLHDVLSQSLYRFYIREKSFFKKIIYYFRYKQMISWERKVFNRAGEITVLNDKDKDIVKTIINGKNVRINVDYPKVSGVFHDVNRNNVTLNNIIFWGAMNRKENIDAVLWFLNEIFPLIIKKIPDSTFYIVGANPPEEIVQMQSEKILVTGFVESPIPFFEKAALSVVPLRFGAGIKLKVLETLTAKIPTLATDVGAEGIDNINGCLFVENEPEKFAAQAVKILESRS